MQKPKDLATARAELIGAKFCGFLPGDPRTPVTLRIFEVEKEGVHAIHDPSRREVFYEWALLGLRVRGVHSRSVKYDAISNTEA